MPETGSIGRAAQRVYDLDAGEILRVVRDDDAAIGFGHGGDDRVERASRPAASLAVGHEARPDQGGCLVEGENPAGEQRLRALGTAEPVFQIVASLACWLFEDAAPDFRDGQRGDVKVFVVLIRQPREEGFRRRRLGGVADDVGVEQVSHQMSVSRPAS